MRLAEDRLLAFLKENTRYENGELICTKRWHCRLKVGKPLGVIKRHYKMISIYGEWYVAHRLIYLFVHGYLPEVVDHIDRDKLNNKIENLRAATKSQNEHNREKYSTNTSGYKGVWFHKPRGKWVAEITVNGKSRKLGLYATPELAAEAYNKAAKENHAEFACLN